MTIPIDVRTVTCPGPVIQLRQLLDEGTTEVALLVANEQARSNVTRFATSRGAHVAAEPHQGGFLVTVQVPAGAGGRQAPTSAGADRQLRPHDGPRVVQLTADTMGSGDDELGALILRGFIKTVAELEPLPTRVVCYNSAVKLCAGGSPALDDLRELEAAGVTIVACGTCVSFFDLKDKLAVGRVTDMLDIVTTLAEAGTVLRP